MDPFFKRFKIALFGILNLVLLMGCRSENTLIIKSDFAIGAEGWTITGDAQGEFSEPSYAKEGGVTNGYIFADDDVKGGVWYFTAPALYQGDKSEFYHTTLKFSLLQEATMKKQFISDDVVIKNDNDQITYVHDKTNFPGKEWTNYEIKINAEQGWFKGGHSSNVKATEEEIKAVLSNITQFSIRGEFETGPDTGALDQVIISKK